MRMNEVRYVVDDRGERTGVLIDIAEFERLMEDIEELEAIRAYDAAKAVPDEVIPFDQATAEIERSRR